MGFLTIDSGIGPELVYSSVCQARAIERSREDSMMARLTMGEFAKVVPDWYQGKPTPAILQLIIGVCGAVIGIVLILLSAILSKNFWNAE